MTQEGKSEIFVEQALRAVISLQLPLPVQDLRLFQRLKIIQEMKERVRWSHEQSNWHGRVHMASLHGTELYTGCASFPTLSPAEDSKCLIVAPARLAK